MQKEILDHGQKSERKFWMSKYYIDAVSLGKLISKIKKHPLKNKIVADIDSLETDFTVGKYLPKHDIYELKYPNLRIYYAVEHGEIVLVEEMFEGIVFFLGKGNKNQQQRFLNEQKSK